MMFPKKSCTIYDEFWKVMRRWWWEWTKRGVKEMWRRWNVWCKGERIARTMMMKEGKWKKWNQPTKAQPSNYPLVISNPMYPFPNKILYPPFDTECHGNVKSTSSNTRMEKKNNMHKKQTNKNKKIRTKKGEKKIKNERKKKCFEVFLVFQTSYDIIIWRHETNKTKQEHPLGTSLLQSTFIGSFV